MLESSARGIRWWRGFRRSGGFLALLAAATASPAAEHVDDAGRRLWLGAPVQRVISLAPSLTEMVYAVGAGASLVATVRGSDFPAAARQLPIVGDHQRLDVERVLSLRPDLLLVWHGGNSQRELAQLEAAGIALFAIEPTRLDDVPRALERLGALVGRAREAARVASDLRRRLADLRVRYASAPSVSVFYQVWQQPLLTLGGPQMTTDVLALCGGRNVFGDIAQRVPQVSVEAVVAADPEVLMTAEAGATLRRAPQAAAWTRWRSFPSMTAVRRGWLYSLPADAISRQGPRIGDGAAAVCEALAEVRAERARDR